MNKQGTGSKRKHVTVTVPQKHAIINRLESGENHGEVMGSYSIELKDTEELVARLS
jgi:hypothetical protein